MMTVLQIGVGCLLTATLLTVALALSAFPLGRLATRNAAQRQVEAIDAPHIRDAVRRRVMIVASLALLAALAGVPLLHAETPEECRHQCSLDLEGLQGRVPQQSLLRRLSG